MISRIQSRQVFQQLQREGTYVRSTSLWCSVIIDKNLVQPAVGYALGRNVGGAVTRNLLRRRIREIIRLRSTPLLPGWYLIGANSSAHKLSYSDLRIQLDTLINKCVTKVTSK